MNFNELPKKFAPERLTRKQLSKDPITQLLEWFKRARERNVDDLNAATLATASKEGIPSCRTVLIKHINHHGLILYTNYKSRKAREMDENPFAMTTIFWKELMQQIHIEGKVEKISKEKSEAYFSKRPRGSQLMAWASNQGQVIKSFEDLLQAYDTFKEKFEGKTIPLPPFWGGYILVPYRFEFWQGGPERLHDRFQYRQEKGEWKLERLSP